MRLVAVLAGMEQGGLRPVFSGGTSLSKAYGLIQRFSEDLDFKFVLPGDDIGRAGRRRYRDHVIETIQAVGDWGIEGDIQSRNESRFFSISLSYPASFSFAAALRPHIKLDINLLQPALPPEERPLRSFVAEARGDDPEVPAILCVLPAETAADKFSALSRHILTRRRDAEGDDATFIRHLHDLAALETLASEHPGFPDLLRRLLTDEAARGGVSPEIAALDPADRLATALAAMAADPDYPREYERFVLGMSYAAEGEAPAFAPALEAARRLSALIDPTPPAR